MKKNKRKKNKFLQHLAFILLGACSGAVIGVLSAANDVHILWTLLIFLAAFYLHFIVHESGHLFFGLLSGYRFVSFRIGSVMLSKQKGRFKFSRYTIAGTGGQCLLAPPEGDPENAPYLLYHLGGVIMNTVVSLLSLLLLPLPGAGRMIGLCIAISGIALALMNGIPLTTAMISNDGKNALRARKDPAFRTAIINQLRINAGLAEGLRLREMPLAWFEMADSAIGMNGVFQFQRLIDEESYDVARLYGKTLLSHHDLPGLYRGLIQNDLVALALLSGERPTVNAELQKFQQAMKTNPSILRTQYLTALLLDRDESAAAKIKEKFDRIAKHYPYPCELMPEQTLMARALEIQLENLKEETTHG